VVTPQIKVENLRCFP